MQREGKNLPDFLIIGAMKAGTTTLFRDLLANPQVFIPPLKEPANLRYDEVLTPIGLDAYARLFENARPHQTLGDASTQYTKMPDFTGSAGRARKLLGPDVRVIYLVREPIARIISHHYHWFTAGQGGADIDREVHEQPQYINWTRYAWQIEPWFDTFDADRIRIVRFEDYVRNRRSTVEALSRFIGIEPRPDLIDESTVFNRSDAKPIVKGFWSRVARSSVYRRIIATRLPYGAKDRLKQLLLPPAPPRPKPPSADTVAFIRDQLAKDQERLRVFMGLDQPVWGERTAVQQGRSSIERDTEGDQLTAAAGSEPRLKGNAL